MTTYVIGDVQGCLIPLQRLLDQLHFDPAADQLIFAGDLVNRGPDSLGVLRLARDLNARAVLGNHDLHLLAVASGGRKGARDTLDALLAAPDCRVLLDWLRAQPLALRDEASGALIIHAGLPPQWDVAQTLRLAAEASVVLRGPQGDDFLARMYGNEPALWTEELQGLTRLRFIVNSLTRLRYCRVNGQLELRHKGAPADVTADLYPWFALPQRRSTGTPIVFGHWSTLGRVHWPEHQVWGLDSGCVWGGRLTALALDSGQLHQTPCESCQTPGTEAD